MNTTITSNNSNPISGFTPSGTVYGQRLSVFREDPDTTVQSITSPILNWTK